MATKEKAEKPDKHSTAKKVLGGGDEKKSSKKKKKHSFRRTEIDHHDDGSHTVRHLPEEGGTDVSYARPDMDGMKAGLDQHLGGAPEAPAEGQGSAAATILGGAGVPGAM